MKYDKDQEIQTSISIDVINNMTPVQFIDQTLSGFMLLRDQLSFDGLKTTASFIVGTTIPIQFYNLNDSPSLLIVDSNFNKVGEIQSLPSKDSYNNILLPSTPGQYYFYVLQSSGMEETLYSKYAVPFNVIAAPTPGKETLYSQYAVPFDVIAAPTPGNITLKTILKITRFSLNEWNSSSIGRMLILTDIATVVGVPVDNITVVSATEGSLILELDISGFSSIQSANDACAALNNLANESQGIILILYCQVIDTAISNICFPAGTPVKTDQGIVPIDIIDTNKHTINGQDILHITKTITLDPYLICFEKDSIERNYPNQTTIMTKDHKIMYKGQLVPAYRFLNMTNNVKKVKYSGEVLYNVLLEDYSTMSVNNMVCETLHPNNVIARLYSSNISDTYKQNLISIMNDALRRKDEVAYKSIVNRI